MTDSAASKPNLGRFGSFGRGVTPEAEGKLATGRKAPEPVSAELERVKGIEPSS